MTYCPAALSSWWIRAKGHSTNQIRPYSCKCKTISIICNSASARSLSAKCCRSQLNYISLSILCLCNFPLDERLRMQLESVWQKLWKTCFTRKSATMIRRVRALITKKNHKTNIISLQTNLLTKIYISLVTPWTRFERRDALVTSGKLRCSFLPIRSRRQREPPASRSASIFCMVLQLLVSACASEPDCASSISAPVSKNMHALNRESWPPTDRARNSHTLCEAENNLCIQFADSTAWAEMGLMVWIYNFTGGHGLCVSLALCESVLFERAPLIWRPSDSSSTLIKTVIFCNWNISTHTHKQNATAYAFLLTLTITRKRIQTNICTHRTATTHIHTHTAHMLQRHTLWSGDSSELCDLTVTVYARVRVWCCGNIHAVLIYLLHISVSAHFPMSKWFVGYSTNTCFSAFLLDAKCIVLCMLLAPPVVQWMQKRLTRSKNEELFESNVFNIYMLNI